jgi:general nucleoside transport system ATP-binding protein
MEVVRHIHKSFGTPMLASTCTSQPGTIQGILGENGAGKSTLMKILSGFIQADSGRNPVR